jgi:hypothetical protein
MVQRSDKNFQEDRDSEAKPIKLPDRIWKEIEERDRKVQQKQNEDREKELANKPPKEREQIEKELKRIKDNKFAPDKRTEEELKLEDEKVMKQLDKMRQDSIY